MSDHKYTPKRGRRPFLMAMVLSGALSAIGAGKLEAAPVAAISESTVTDISRYCTACWRNARIHPSCWNDCTQEVFQRLLERVTPQTWDVILHSEGDERRELVRAIDAVKKRTQRGWKRAAGYLTVVADGTDAIERDLAEQREVVDQAATDLLSERQQRILKLSFEGWSVQEIADHLETPAERISDEKYKAIRKLRTHLCNSDGV